MNSSTGGGNPRALLTVAKKRYNLPAAGASAKAQAQVERAKEKGKTAEQRKRKATTEFEHHTMKNAATTKKLREAEGNLKRKQDQQDAATKRHQEVVDDLKKTDDKIANHPGKHADLTPKFIKGAAEELGIVDEVATGSHNTKKLKNDKNILSHKSKNKLKWQGEVDLSSAQVASKSATAVYKGTNAEWSGVLYGSKGFKVNPKTNKRVCIATSEMTAAKWQAQENKPSNGEENKWCVRLPQVTFSSDGVEMGMELWDKHGKRVTEEMYQQNNELAKTVWVPNPDRMGELFDLLNKTGDGKKKWTLGSWKKYNKMYKLLKDNDGTAMFFKIERVNDGEVLVGCHASDKRLKTAGYKITIHEKSKVQCFAPYDDLALNVKSAPKKKAASKN